MTRIYYNEKELDQIYNNGKVMAEEGYTLRAPWPQAFLVTVDPQLPAQNNLTVRSLTYNPLSWNPYSMSVAVRNDDIKVLRGLSLNGECVMALPSRDMLRQLTICAQNLPLGVSEAQVARLNLVKSQYVNVPSLDDCPVNFECKIGLLQEYYTHTIVFLNFVGASIQPEMLFKSREEIVAQYPTNFIDEIEGEDGIVRQRVGLISELFLCPTFPVGPKLGWYSDFKGWMKDLAEENYISSEELEKAVNWYDRWKAIYATPESAERAQMQERFTEFSRLLANEQWDEIHTLLAKSE